MPSIRDIDICFTCFKEEQDKMVCCDDCNKWHHYGCVNVDDNIRHKPWSCNKCEEIKSPSVNDNANKKEGNQQQIQTNKADSDRQVRTNKAVDKKQSCRNPSINSIAALSKSSRDEGALNRTSRSKSGKSSANTVSSSIIAARLKLLEEERAQRERREEEEIQFRMEQLKVEQRLEKERLEIRAQELQMRQKREQEALAGKRKIIEDYRSEDKVRLQYGKQSMCSTEIEHRTCQWVYNMPRDFPETNEITRNRINQTEFGNIPFTAAAGPLKLQQKVQEKTLHHQHEKNKCYEMNDEPTLGPSQIAARQVLPKDLPTFSGDPIEWPFFLSAFHTTTKQCGYSNAENTVRLQRCLKGDALAAVKFCLLSPTKVPEVINTLRMMFGKPEVIIFSIIEQIRSEPTPRAENLPSLISFALSVRNLSSTIEATGLSEHLNNPTLMYELVNKLPAQNKLEWAKYKRNHHGPADLKLLSEWLYDLAEAASDVSVGFFRAIGSNTERKSKMHLHAAHTTKFTSQAETAHNLTSLCVMGDRQSHKLQECPRFRQLTPARRWDVIRNYRLCRTCLKNHTGNRCKDPERCGVDNCRRWHNKLLHIQQNNKRIVEEQNNVIEQLKTSSWFNVNTHRQNKTCFRIVPVVLRGECRKISTFAFLDDGSSVTLLEEEIANQLGLSGPVEDLCLKWTAEESRIEANSRYVSLEIGGIEKDSPMHRMSNVRTVQSLNLPIQSLDVDSMASKFRHCRHVPIRSYTNARPTILIGIDHPKLAVPLENREGGWSDPILTRTRLGWCVHGPTSNATHRQAHSSFHICDCNEESLHEVVKNYFSIENFGVNTNESNTHSVENKRAIDILDKTAKKVGSQYEVGLLWKFQDIQMPNSYPMAKRRLMCLEKKMETDIEYATKLREQINYYIKQGYARKLRPDELNRSLRTWYLPIFTTKNPNKPDKFRIVWDAAAKVNGICLNTMLSKGPDLLSPLIYVLYRFRERQIGICADLKEMFHQVKIIPEDQDSQRFLWREGKDREPDEYVMQVMTFGAACSPCAAQFIKNKNARHFQNEFPRATEAIIEKHYVDDYLDSMNTAQEAIEIAKQVQYIHAMGGFELRNWFSNSNEVTEALNTSSSTKVVNMNVSEQPEKEKILGMWWRLQDDTFTFSINYGRMDLNIVEGSRVPTKREILRTLMTIYDPLGLLSPFLIYLKILLQDVWRSKVEWDEEIDEDQNKRWRKWIKVLDSLADIRIPRCYSTKVTQNKSLSLQLHTFVDASAEAYAAVCYFRFEDSKGINCAIVSSKTKVAPLNPISIPRMELQAAVLGSRLAANVEKGHSLKITKRFFWTDSRTVLCWLRGDPKQYRQFVSFRIGEILETTNIEEWRWISTKLNVADDATKWHDNFKIKSTDRWFTGPSFLLKDEKDWPENIHTCSPTTAELKVHIEDNFTHDHPKVLIDVNDYSDWRRLLRVQSYFSRAVVLLRHKQLPEKVNTSTHQNISHPTHYEILQAEKELFKLAQQAKYKDEIRALRKSGCTSINKSSSIYASSPYLDGDGLLRVRGRIEALVEVQADQKRPIILPRSHKITQLIIYDCHKQHNHINHETVINELRQRFAIPKIRVALKSVRKACQVCKNLNAKPNPPEMGALPRARLSPFIRPFTFVGMDFFGPIEVTVGRRCEKRWGAIFTCMTIRAIHIEVAHGLTTDSCIMVIRNFVSRRGQPKEIFCDNGTNFHGAANELQKELRKLPCGTIASAFSNVKWNFNPPAAPHMGGAWERMIRTVKKNLMLVLPTRKPSDELLRSCLIEIEGIINSRPLTYMPVDPKEPEAITPNHFLLGSSSGLKPSGEFTDDVMVLRKNWKISQQVAQHFWKRWLHEYIPTITRRTKWYPRAKPIKIGDIVLIADENSPRNSWPLGKIIDTKPGKDGQTRQATIYTTTGIYVRPATKIAVLDVRDNEEYGKLSCPANVPGGSVNERAE